MQGWLRGTKQPHRHIQLLDQAGNPTDGQLVARGQTINLHNKLDLIHNYPLLVPEIGTGLQQPIEEIRVGRSTDPQQLGSLQQLDSHPRSEHSRGLVRQDFQEVFRIQ